MCKKIISNIFTGAACIAFAWLLLSWLDVVIHNLTPGYEYSNINLLYLITKGIL